MKNLIIETDFFSDVDDAGALAIAHAYADEGLANILAINLNTPSRYGIDGVRAINAFYGRPQIPVGRFAQQDDSVFERDYARTIAHEFPPPPAERSVKAVQLLRETLAAADVHSVTIISLGFLDNLAALLTTGPDGTSPAPGLELVDRKVASCVVMGGCFPEGTEFNLAERPAATLRFLAGWPTTIDFLGHEVGEPVITGATLTSDADRNPVARAYAAFNGSGYGRHSWDLQTVDLAVRGEAAPYRMSSNGWLRFETNGHNSWEDNPAGTHRYTIATATPNEIAEELNDLLSRAPRLR